MKLTTPEHNGALQLIPSVGPTKGGAMRPTVRKTIFSLVAVVVLMPPAAIAIGLLSMLAAAVDDRAGVLTGRAIEVVQAEREGSETVGQVVARGLPDAHWSAAHEDDDLFVVRVTALSRHPRDIQWAQWCVVYRPSHAGHLGLAVDAMFPATRGAQDLAPTAGMPLERLPGGGPSSCAALQSYFAPAARGGPTRG
jgi:hypothetical protein